MKKLTTLLAFIALASVGMAATLFTAENPKPGLIDIRGNVSGKIAAVDVFSTNATGTVSISRVFSAPFYTNAYEVSTSVETNVDISPVYGEYYLVSSQGMAYTNASLSVGDGNIFDIVYIPKDTNSANDSVYHKSGTSTYFHYTPGDTSGTMEYTTIQNEMITFRRGGEITFERKRDIVGQSVSTNVVDVVKTNSVTAIKAYDLVVTNSVITGTCENNCFIGTPSSSVWIYPKDKIIFNGSATGGSLRIVIE